MTIAPQLLQSQVQITVAGMQVIHMVGVMHLVLGVRHVNAVQKYIRTRPTQCLSLAHRFPEDGTADENKNIKER